MPVSRIYYYVPPHELPSWGIGLLLGHVSLLCEQRRPAWAVSERPLAGPATWLDLSVPFISLSEVGREWRPTDILVVPEVSAAHPGLLSAPCRKIVFVQASILIHAPFAEGPDYENLGFEHAITVMEHLRHIVSYHHHLGCSIIPPFVAPYFFARPEQRGVTRQPEIVLFPKPGYLEHGIPDQTIFMKTVRRRMLLDDQLQSSRYGWRFVFLQGLRHRQVAAALQRACFFVNLNSMEALNITVLEAMAAGCIPLCFESIGGSEYLENGSNAFVFPNHQVYPLLEKLYELVEGFPGLAGQLHSMRVRAQQTAMGYTRDKTGRALDQFFNRL
jgi:hypothetical protein